MQSITPTTKAKDRYKLINWKEYNAGLCKRGSLTLWIAEPVLKVWGQIDASKKVVGEKLYPDSIILCCLTLGMQYHQKLRQTTGFVSSILTLLGKGYFSIPDYSTLSRRQNILPVSISDRLNKGENLDIAIDSTGLKVYGEGEWKVRQHGITKRRTWRKLHIGIDVNTQEIICVDLTTNSQDDASIATKMLKGKTEKLKSFRGDGAYDDFDFRKTLGKTVRQIIPPPKNAVLQKNTIKKPLPDYLEQRNEAVNFINKQNRKQWKIQESYHKRSLNEVVMFRYKITFGGNMNARKIENQQTEVKIKCAILNKYSRITMPISVKAA